MPQLQLPTFPAGATEITRELAVQQQDGTVFYLYGHVPVFQHAEHHLKSFRMFTSQLIVNGTVKEKDIVRRFGVPRGGVLQAVPALLATGVSMRAAIRALSRFGIASRDVTRKLEKEWAEYRKLNGLDLYENSESEVSWAPSCVHG